MRTYGEIVQVIKPLLPNGWRFIGYGTTLDEPDAVAVVLTPLRVSRNPNSPFGGYVAEWVLQVITPYTDPKKADPSLFDNLLTLLAAMDDSEDSPQFGWTEAGKVAEGSRLTYEVQLTVLIPREAS